jgi:hypothetical protein
MQLETAQMKKLLTAVLVALSSTAFAATLSPVSLINPAGSTAGQVIVSTGPTTPPAWTTVSLSGLGALSQANNLSDVASIPAARTNLGLGTAATVNTGSSGATIPLLNGTNTWSGGQTFSGAIAGIPGRLLNVQVFSSTGTYTPTSGTASIVVEVQAAGGSGGGAAVTTTGQSASGSGGGGGSYAKVRLTSGFSGVTVTIPAAVSGTSGAAGTAGSAASFGSLVSCPGGTAGTLGTATSGTVVLGSGGVAAVCTISAGTILANIAGQGGLPALVITPGAGSLSGAGGSSPLGGGAGGRGSSGAGSNGTGNGAGGAGANNQASQSAAAGGGSSAGEVIVYEYQ